MRWWRALCVTIAGWEIFLRVDSRLLAPTTKLWLFPLMTVVLAGWGAEAGRLIGAFALAWADPTRARNVTRFAFVAGTAIAVTFEFACLVYHHAPQALGGWPIVAIVAAAGALVWSRRAAKPLLRRASITPPAFATLTTVGATLAFAAALARPDVATALIKRQSAVGRLLGHGLALVPPRLAAPRAPLVRPPDVPPAQGLARGNVILLSIDTLRRDGLGVYSGARAAPGPSATLDAFAGESLVFDDAYTQSPNSAPSMATVLSGLYPFRHGVRYNRMALGTGVPTLGETLTRAGYSTAAFVTNVTLSEPFGFARGFETFRYLPSQQREDGLLLDTADPQAVDGALAWVRTRPPRPFLLWVHLMAPHWPYLPPADLRPENDGWNGPWFNVLNMSKHEAPLAHRRPSFDRGVYTALYAAEIASADRLCGQLLRGLDALDALEGAHVILLADHGEAFGESDVFGHGRSFDPAETRVPLVWRLPGALRSGTRITTTVQLADLVPTLLRLLGVPAPANLDGRDLSGVVLGDVAGDDGFAFSEARYLHSMGVRGLLYAVRTRRRTIWLDAGYRYAGEFDRTVDPEERDRRAYRAGSDDALHDALVGLAAAAQHALTTSAPAIAVDAVAEERLRALGYVQ